MNADSADPLSPVRSRPWDKHAALLFDLDGVLTDTAAVHAAAWKRVFDDFLAVRAKDRPVVPFSVEEDYAAYVDGRPRYEGVATFLASRGIRLEHGSPKDATDAMTVCGLGNRKNEYFAAELDEHGVEVFFDAVALLDAARAAGLTTAVVSASKNARRVLAAVGLLDRFDAVLTGLEAEARGLVGKPAPDTFLAAAADLGVRPKDAVVLEDAVAGVRAGRAGGFGLVIGVDRVQRPEALAENGADVVLADLRALLRPSVPLPARAPAVEAPAALDVRAEGIVVALPPGGWPADPKELDGVVLELREHGVDVVVVDEPAEVGAEVAAMADRLARRGIGSGLLLCIGWVPPFERSRATERVVVASTGTDGAAAEACLAGLRRQVDRRDGRGLPSIDTDPRWTVVLTGDSLAERRPAQSILTVSDTVFGTRGVREEDSHGALPRVLAAGVYDESAEPPTLLEGPSWTGLHLLRHLDHGADRRLLDLRTGVLVREQPAEPVALRTLRFATLARPGGGVLRAEGAIEWLHAGTALLLPPVDGTFERRQRGHVSTARSSAVRGGSISAAAVQEEHTRGDTRVVDRLVCLRADRAGRPRTEAAMTGLAGLEDMGVDGLLAEQRAAWAGRWDDALVEIEGDAELELGVRFSLFHLIGSTPTEGEAAVGARGVSGPAYRGHVFWDTDVFMLPFFAATHPESARAMLEYRIRRLGPAREAAERDGRRGARFPWESAGDGHDVTPREDRPLDGPVIPILTGELEEHIVADVAWAAMQYVAWTGDEDFLRGQGGPLVLETARYWASRVETDPDGRGHLRGVIGPDEYHEDVDDNAFTNVIARWNLRRAAELAEAGRGDVAADEVAQWRRVADSLVDNYDHDTGLYEQFAGFFDLDDVVVSRIATTPLAADLVLGRPFVHRSTVIKQPDVLMLHHLVPEETAPGSLETNLAYYEPRTSHGSSLSPAIHAGLLARLGRLDEAVRLFRMACRLDLDNLTNTTAHGLHLATFGGLWQALVFGFLGIRPTPAGLTLDPRIPSGWGHLRLHLRHRGRRVQVVACSDRVEVTVDGPLTLVVDGAPVEVVATGRWRRAGDRWSPA